MMEACVASVREYLPFSSVRQQKRCCVLPFQPFSHSAFTALICHLRLHGMSSIHNTHTHTHTHVPPTLVLCHVVCSVLQNRVAIGQPPVWLSGQPDVCGGHAVSAFCYAVSPPPPTPPPSPPIISSHATQPLLLGITGHPWRHWSCVVATRIRLRGRRGHVLSSLLREGRSYTQEVEGCEGGDE